MICLAPLALFGALLLILPIVVHLFKPRKMKQTPFSSLRWLKQTHQRLSRRIQWHQWLLFLLRAGCILLLVMALAKPLLGLWGERGVDRFVIVDVSHSMACRVEETSTPLERAKALTDRLVQTARVGDRTVVIVVGSSPRLIAGPSNDVSTASGLIRELKASEADASLSGALPLVRSQLSDRDKRDVELVFLTDNLEDRWQQKDLHTFMEELPNEVRVKVIDVGPGTVANAWIANARVLQFADEPDRVVRVEIGCNREPDGARSVSLKGVAGLDDEKHAVTLKPGALVRVDFRLPASLDLQGQVAELRLEPADAMPGDDVFFLNLDTALALRVLLIEPETLGPDGRRVGVFLQEAMNALASAKNQALDVVTKSATQVTASDIRTADVIVLADASSFADATVASLEGRVRAGAGLAWFLGPSLRPVLVNAKLHRAEQPGEGLLPFSLKASDWQGTAKFGELTGVRWRHPILAAVQDPVLSDFTQSRVRRYAKLVGTAGKHDMILARFDDDVPAIVDHPFGAGRVLVFNMSANDEWGDLPRRRSFVPLLDKTLAYLSAGAVRRNFTVGSAAIVPLPAGTAKSEVSVVGPSGKLSPRFVVRRGQTFLHLDEVADAGVYRIKGAGTKEIVFTVNVSRAASALRAMDTALLTEWWTPATVEFLNAESAHQQLDQQSKHWPLWPMLVFFAGLLLVAETIYVHRLCPRGNPKAAESVVPQRGMMKPVAEKTA